MMHAVPSIKAPPSEALLAAGFIAEKPLTPPKTDLELDEEESAATNAAKLSESGAATQPALVLEQVSAGAASSSSAALPSLQCLQSSISSSRSAPNDGSLQPSAGTRAESFVRIRQY